MITLITLWLIFQSRVSSKVWYHPVLSCSSLHFAHLDHLTHLVHPAHTTHPSRTSHPFHPSHPSTLFTLTTLLTLFTLLILLTKPKFFLKIVIFKSDISPWSLWSPFDLFFKKGPAQWSGFTLSLVVHPCTLLTLTTLHTLFTLLTLLTLLALLTLALRSLWPPCSPCSPCSPYSPSQKIKRSCIIFKSDSSPWSLWSLFD